MTKTDKSLKKSSHSGPPTRTRMAGTGHGGPAGSHEEVAAAKA